MRVHNRKQNGLPRDDAAPGSLLKPRGVVPGRTLFSDRQKGLLRETGLKNSFAVHESIRLVSDQTEA